MSENPYEAPAALVDDVPRADADTDAERRAHLRRESGLRAVGVLCAVFGAYFVLMAGVFGAQMVESAQYMLSGFSVGITLVFGAIGAMGLATAWGYLRLRPWVRVPGGVVAGLVLLTTMFLSLPLVGYAAYLTYSAKGLRVLSPPYAATRARTPHLRAWKHPAEALALLGIAAAYVGVFAWFASRLPMD